VFVDVHHNRASGLDRHWGVPAHLLRDFIALNFKRHLGFNASLPK